MKRAIHAFLLSAAVFMMSHAVLEAADAPPQPAKGEEKKAPADAKPAPAGAGQPEEGEPSPAEKVPAPPAEEKKTTWLDMVKISGDMRLIYDRIEYPGWTPEVPDRDRLRFRARLGVDVKVCEEIDIKFRAASAESRDIGRGGANITVNQTMTGGWSKKGVWIDIAQVAFKVPMPDGFPSLGFVGGKMEQPWTCPGKSDLIWDPDVTPEGIILKTAYKALGGDLEAKAFTGVFVVMESVTKAESLMLAFQASAKLTMLEGMLSVCAGIGTFDFTAARGRDVFDYSGTNNSYGNSTVGTKYMYDYNEIELFLEVAGDLEAGGKKIPYSVYGDYVINVAGGVGENRGWLVGVTVGGDVKFTYNYRSMGKDAIVSAFNDWDSWGGGTDAAGHKIAVTIKVLKNFSVDLLYIVAEKSISDASVANRDYSRFIVMATVSF